MDSSSMAAMALRVSGAAGAPVRLRAMTVLYDRIMPSEERRYAGEVAERLGIPIDVFDGGSHGLLAPPIATERPLELYTSGGWIELFREAGDQGGGLLHGEGGDSLFSYSAGPATLKGAALLMVARDLMRLRRRYGTWPGLGTGLLARLQRVTGARGGGRSVEGYPYPPWLNPDFERRLNLRERWQDFWHRIPSPLNERHPRMHEGLVGPDWNLQGNYLHPGFPMPEIGDPFLDLRLIELVLALPPLPWTFRKHLLRRSMADVLPEAVLRRPKTPLGEIHRVLLARPEAGWVDDWRAGPALGAYVRAEKLPPLRGEEAIAGESYVNLRPLLLERWIGTVSSTLAIGGSPPRLSPSLVPGDGLVPLEGLATD
jgi:asparagine synthase (glutamine-hydrolysing)